MEAMIARYGWAVLGVGDDPLFAYTVGLADKGLPEIIVIGLPMKIAHQFLNELGRRFTSTGVPPLDTNIDDLAKGLPAQLIAAPRSETDKYMFASKARCPTYTAVQLAWCDKAGRFPWHADFDPTMFELQPILRRALN